jgi:hypothetical protein
MPIAYSKQQQDAQDYWHECVAKGHKPTEAVCMCCKKHMGVNAPAPYYAIVEFLHKWAYFPLCTECAESNY